MSLEIQLGDGRNYFHNERERKDLILQGKKAQHLPPPTAIVREREYLKMRKVHVNRNSCYF